MRERTPAAAPWIALAMIAAWVVGLVAILVELGNEAKRLERRQGG